jgi:hypothetical protein
MGLLVESGVGGLGAGAATFWVVAVLAVAADWPAAGAFWVVAGLAAGFAPAGFAAG